MPAPEIKSATAKPVIAMDAAFSFVLYPEISFSDAVKLSEFCSLKEISSSSFSFELTSRSAVRGFDQGIKAHSMLELLNNLSLNRIDGNLNWTLKEWEGRYLGVSFHQGVILSLSEEHRYLTETAPLSGLIQKTLAPGVYLLSALKKAESIRALRKAGIDIIAQPLYDRNITGGVSQSQNTFPHLSSMESVPAYSVPASSKAEEDEKSSSNAEESLKEAEAAKEKFRLVLDNMKLSKPEREELLARIERRLVLSEAQLEATTLRYEKLQARGLDYTGKATIAKQAIEAGSLVEITWHSHEGEQQCTLGVPLSLEKKDGESILVLRSNDDVSQGNTFSVSLSKISLLRRIKQSIFGE
jgi:hypothetical protein